MEACTLRPACVTLLRSIGKCCAALKRARTAHDVRTQSLATLRHPPPGPLSRAWRNHPVAAMTARAP
jgi:hypothetical protein